MRRIQFTVASLLASAAWAQPAPAPAAAPIEFEVSSIKPVAPSQAPQVRIDLQIDGSQVHMKTWALKDYIRIAYRLKDYQISGPEWIFSARFDVDAKLPAGGTRDQVPEMLQSLLTTRFGLKTHRESKEFPVYALVRAGGEMKLKQTVEDPATAGADTSKDATQVSAMGGPRGINVSLGKGASFTFSDNKLVVKKLTVERFADVLARFLDRPVVDMTELKGNYDIELNITPEDYRVMLIRSAINAGVNLPPEALRLLEGTSGDSLHAALRLVGLKLESRKAPLDMLVVDHMEKAPTDN